MPPKGLKINDALLFIGQPDGKMIPLGNIKEVEETVLSDEDGNKAISHMYKDMTFECELENVKWNKITLIKIVGLGNAIKIFLQYIRRKLNRYIRK